MLYRVFFLELAMLTFLYYLNRKIKVDRAICLIYFHSCHVKYKFASKLIQLVTVVNLFPLNLYKVVNIVNFVHYGKTRMLHCQWRI